MAHNYYLLNGKNGTGNSLYLLKNGKLLKNFVDISTLDILTLDISREKANDILKEYNPNTDLSGVFYNASFPHSKTKIKTYATIFGDDNDKSKYFFDKLKYFAEQRNFKKEHKEKLKLDENRVFDDYIRKILFNILSKQNSILVNYESLMSAKIKEMIRERYLTGHNMSTDNYINSKIYLFRNILSNYTELRNITLEYILYIEGLNTNIRSKVKNKALWDNLGMYPEEPIDYIDGKIINRSPIYTQMELSDYIAGFPKVKQLKK